MDIVRCIVSENARILGHDANNASDTMIITLKINDTSNEWTRLTREDTVDLEIEHRDLKRNTNNSYNRQKC
jgi:hypothetical protein